MRFRDSFLLDRIFSIFDQNQDGDISFQEYLSCLSIISNKGTNTPTHTPSHVTP